MIQPPHEFWAALESAYSTPPRAYHNMHHVREVLAHFNRVRYDVGWPREDEVFVAVLCHDAVYLAGRNDNEERSAQLARALIRRWLAKLAIDSDYVAALVELTARHGRLSPGDVSDEEALFLDCDMAILGAPAETYDAFAHGVRTEYLGVVTALQYRAGRLAFLQRLLECPRIFLSDYFHERLDADARANVARELARHQNVK